MDGAYFTPPNEILDFFNSFLSMNLTNNRTNRKNQSCSMPIY